MEFNEQNKLTRKIETDSQLGWRVGVGGIEQRRKKGKELTDTDNSVVIAGVGGGEIGRGGRGNRGAEW